MDAPGLPNRKHFEPIPAATLADWQYVIQQHLARRAGKHYDLRLAPDDNAHSWALRKLPEPGQKTLAVQQPTHTRSYMDWSGTIQKGYGAGSVNTYDRGNVKVISSSPDKIVFHRYKGNKAEEYALVRTKDKKWLLVNSSTTPDKYKFPQTKPKYTALPWDKSQLPAMQGVMTPKFSGAHGLVVLREGQYPRIFSVRRSTGGGIIEWTHKMPSLFTSKVPKGINTVLRAEVFLADSEGNPLPEERTAGVLNAGIDKSISLQKNTGGLQIVPFAVADSDDDYEKQLSHINNLATRLPFLRTLETARSTKEKRQLMDKIESGQHATSEGVVLQGDKTYKSKLTMDADIYPLEAFEGLGKYKGSAGGFTYALEPGGKPVGKVGGGFSDKLRKELWENSKRLKDRVAVIEYNKQMPSGAYYAPRFKGWHMDKGEGAMDKEAKALHFKIGFMRKLAEYGITPSQYEAIVAANEMEKSAGISAVTGPIKSLVGGAAGIGNDALLYALGSLLLVGAGAGAGARHLMASDDASVKELQTNELINEYKKQIKGITQRQHAKETANSIV